MPQAQRRRCCCCPARTRQQLPRRLQPGRRCPADAHPPLCRSARAARRAAWRSSLAAASLAALVAYRLPGFFSLDTSRAPTVEVCGSQGVYVAPVCVRGRLSRLGRRAGARIPSGPVPARPDHIDPREECACSSPASRLARRDQLLDPGPRCAQPGGHHRSRDGLSSRHRAGRRRARAASGRGHPLPRASGPHVVGASGVRRLRHPRLDPPNDRALLADPWAGVSGRPG